jgi:hypothetical protein
VQQQYVTPLRYRVAVLRSVVVEVRQLIIDAAVSGDGMDKDEPWMYMPAKEVEHIFFGGRAKRRKAFLRKHPAVRTQRPMTKDGQPHRRRLNIHVLDFMQALRQDEYFANDPSIRKRIERNLQRAEINERLANATNTFFGIRSPAKGP